MSDALPQPLDFIEDVHIHGGLFNKQPYSLIPDGFLVESKNVVYSEEGSLHRRPGVIALTDPNDGNFNSSTHTCLSIYAWDGCPNGPTILAHMSNGRLYATNGTTRALQNTAIKTGLSTTVPMSFEVFNSFLWMTDGTGFFKWDGTTYSTVGGAPSGNIIRLWQDTMWMASTSSDRVYSSTAGDPTSWPALSYVDIGKGVGDNTTCLANDGNFLLVFKRESYYLMTDPVTFANRVLDQNKGCESHFSVVHFLDSMYFVSRVGICEHAGSQPAIILTQNIEGFFIDVDFVSSTFARADAQKIWGYTAGHKVGWIIPGIGALEYYPTLQTPADQLGSPYVTRPRPWLLNQWPVRQAVSSRVGGAGCVWVTSSANGKQGYIDKAAGSTTTDWSASFTAYFQPRWVDAGSPQVHKYLKTVWVQGRGKVGTQFMTDLDNSTVANENISTLTADDSSSIGIDLLHVDQYGLYHSMRIGDPSTSLGGKHYRQLNGTSITIESSVWSITRITVGGKRLGVRD